MVTLEHGFLIAGPPTHPNGTSFFSFYKERSTLVQKIAIKTNAITIYKYTVFYTISRV